MPLRFDAPRQVQAKVLHGPLLLRVLGARKIAWVLVGGLGGLLGRKSPKSLDPMFGCQECSLEKPWGQDRDGYPFLCLFARRCLPQMGRRI